MAARHSNAERLKLKNILRSAITALCQNSVKFNSKLSVEALIGITVDDGADFLIVSLNEVIGMNAPNASDGQYYQPDDCEDAQYAEIPDDDFDLENLEYFDTGKGEDEYGNSEQSYMPYNTVIKEELMSTISYNNDTYTNHQSATSAAMPHSFKNKPYVSNPHPSYNEAARQQNFGSNHTWDSVPAAASKIYTQSFGGQKRAKVTTPRKKVEKTASKMSRDGGTPQNRPIPSNPQAINGEDAVAQITLYTCGACGAQMQNYGSFMRHKQSHAGLHLCQCDGCGRTIKRRDNLLKHQTRCQAYLNLVQAGGGVR